MHMGIANRIYQLYMQNSFRPGPVGFLINSAYIVRTAIYRAIQRNAKELSGNVLDFGCGSKAYEHLFTVDKYTGIDVEQSGHGHEQEQIDVVYDGKIMPFADATFDGCFCSQVFEHLFDIELSIQEIHRVLKPGGKFLLLVPFVWHEHEVPYDFGRYSAYGLTHLLTKHGFVIKRQEKDSHFMQVVAQLWSLYLYTILHTKNKYLNIITSILLVFPSTLIGWILAAVLPKNHSLYFNTVIVAEKPAPSV